MTDVDHHEDPYPRYAELRSSCPVAHSDRHGGYWILARQSDIIAALKDPVTFSSRRVTIYDKNSQMPPEGSKGPNGLDLGAPLSLSTMDPPMHTAYRQQLLPLFSARRVETWIPGIRSVARGLLEELRPKGLCEFSSEFAAELVLQVFLDILGVPDGDRGFIKQVHESLRLLPQGGLTPAEAKEAQIQELSYYGELLASTQGGGAAEETIVSYLNSAEVGGRPLTLQEKMRLCQQFSRAGLHSTASTLSNMMCFLATHLAHRDRLVNHPELIPNAVEEMIRFESIPAPARLVTREVEIRGERLHEGEMVLLPLGSAGRDEDVYEDADHVDFDRADIEHLGFGAGRHRCIGMHLAKAQLLVALEEIHKAIPDYRLMENRPLRRYTGTLRGTNELWLQFGGTAVEGVEGTQRSRIAGNA